MMSKVKSLSELEEACSDLHATEQKVVLCHGVFDLIHIGHVRHFEVAKKHGDILIVTITGDSFVNKGPDRPVFPSELRSEMLAAMDIIDYVAVIEDTSARPSIETVKPDVYVKGGEYAKHSDDVTNKIAMEVNLVESFGGQVIYTDDVTFSSSNLLNNYFNLHDKPARAFLNKLKGDNGEALIKQYFEDISKLKVLVLGEAIIDEYQYVAPMGKAAKEHILATHFTNYERFAGGVIAATNHIASMCAEVEVMALVGDGNEDNGKENDSFQGFIRESLDDNIKLSLVERPNAPTTRKIRFVEPTYVRKLFEVYHMDDSPLPEDVRTKFRKDLTKKIRDVDLVILLDFGHGFMDPDVIELLEREASFLAINVQSNSANTGYNLITKYRRADLVCIDAMEARLAARDKHSGLSTIVSETLPCLINSNRIIVTHGKHGCFTFDAANRDPLHIPAFKRSVVDTIGAGDAFFVMASLFAAVGAGNEISAFAGNVAGSLKVGIVGHRKGITKLQLQRSIMTLMK